MASVASIDRSKIAGQLRSFEAQEQQLVQQLAEVHGAQRLCRHWLGQLDREEDAARAEAEAGAELAAGELAGTGDAPTDSF